MPPLLSGLTATYQRPSFHPMVRRRKDPNAVGLGKKRMAKLTKRQRSEFARLGGIARQRKAKENPPPAENNP